MVWSLEDLKRMTLPGLGRLDGNLQKKVIGIAERRSPAATFDLVEAILRNCGWASVEANQVARSVSWLAVARRQDKSFFLAIIAEIENERK